MDDDLPQSDTSATHHLQFPSPARIYDYLAGGSFHTPLDRLEALRIENVLPCAPALTRAHRRFLLTSIQTMLDAGIEQFLDLGAGLPTAGSATDFLARCGRTVRIVGVDNEAATTAEARRLAPAHLQVVHADLVAADIVLREASAAGLDLARPVGLLAVDVLHAVTKPQALATALGIYRSGCAEGSMLAVSVLSDISATHDLQPFLEFRLAEGQAVRPYAADVLREILGAWAPAATVTALEEEADLPAFESVLARGAETT
ncbi:MULTISPECIES: SAM-dependent methyltransferase [unclassified Crossiella]|uniref:SAM-dependent methyltransferase n=1 Tax=unclassified Crossiella TaxID=2620835 RepID=UPI0020000951|nr:MULTISPECIES: SAM-dependent methyltransferase [unclassified Crossiella]MCK2243718.1 SAM-dependent methyltransferase [Crossiella sp. S99.2]MCK2257577.1 SAM-dependent methyltransferase [Crossiella sp. S99.1]